MCEEHPISDGFANRLAALRQRYKATGGLRSKQEVDRATLASAVLAMPVQMNNNSHLAADRNTCLRVLNSTERRPIVSVGIVEGTNNEEAYSVRARRLRVLQKEFLIMSVKAISHCPPMRKTHAPARAFGRGNASLSLWTGAVVCNA
jgi:hypothetical protein